jgi:hypothetical protein
MKFIRPSILLIAILSILVIASSFNAATQDQGEIKFINLGSLLAVLQFINSQEQSGIELENLQVTADYDGAVEFFSVFYREAPAQGVPTPWILNRFASSFIGVAEAQAIEDTANLALTYLNFVDGDTSEPHMAVRSATLATYADDMGVHFEVFHRENDRGDPATYGWEWFTRFGDRELSTLLLLLNGQFQENPTAFYPSDILSIGRRDIDEHVYFNYYQVGMIGNAFSTPVGWGAQTFTNAEAVVAFLNAENPEEFRVSADHDGFERFRVFYR